MTTSFQVEHMQVNVYDSNDAMGEAAANALANILEQTVVQRGEAAIIIATGNSQLSFVRALRVKSNVPWDKISVFHMDEYLDISPQHTASFRRWVCEKLVNYVHPRNFFGLGGDAADPEAEMSRYAALLEEHRPVATVLGIGENGHLAFNDPPADFNTHKVIHVVTLADSARQQQVGEGHFASLDQVPTYAISLTIPALLRPANVLAVVPEMRKAAVVKAALGGSITPGCPASILRTFTHVKLYLDLDSASLLRQLA